MINDRELKIILIDLVATNLEKVAEIGMLRAEGKKTPSVGSLAKFSIDTVSKAIDSIHELETS